MANRIVRSIRAIRDINKQPLFTNEQNDLLSDTNDDVYVRLARRYERITGLPELENKFRNHVKDYNQFKDDTQNMLIYLNNENERQDKMIDKLNTDVDELNKKAKRLKDITDEHTEQLKSLTDDLNEFKTDVKNNREEVQSKLDELSSTLDTIQENDKQDKLQSEIDELRKTIDTMQSDIKDVQSIEDARNFFSVSSNLSENVAGQIDKIYFDVYCLDTSTETDFELQIQKMDVEGNWDRGTYINQENLSITPYNNNRYYSISYDISDLEKIVSFTLTNNGNVIHIRQVKLSDY